MPHKKLHVYVNAIDSVFRYRTGALSYKSLTVIINMYTYVRVYILMIKFLCSCMHNACRGAGGLDTVTSTLIVFDYRQTFDYSFVPFTERTGYPSSIYYAAFLNSIRDPLTKFVFKYEYLFVTSLRFKCF